MKSGCQQLVIQKIGRSILLILWLGSTWEMIGQESPDYIYNQVTYSTDDGLSSNFINDIYHDSRGFIWIGTDYGLNRFDGIEFKKYYANRSNIADNGVSLIREDGYGKLWIIKRNLKSRNYQYFYTDQKISCFDFVTEQATSLKETYPDIPFQQEEILDIKQDDRQRLWITTLGGFLYLFEDAFKLIYHSPKEDAIAFPLHNGEALLQQSEQLIKIDSTGKIINSIPFVAHLFLTHQNSQGNVFMLVNAPDGGKRVLVMDEDMNLSPLEIPIPSKRIDMIGIDERDLLWVANDSGEVMICSNDLVDHTMVSQDILVKDQISSQGYEMYRDRLGGLWFADRQGLNHIIIKKSNFQSLLNHDNVSIRDIIALNDSIYYINTYSGDKLFNIKSGKFQAVVTGIIEKSHSIGGLFHQGYIYNSGYGNLVYKINVQESDKILIYGTEGNVYTRCLLPTPPGNRILVGRSKGLAWLDVTKNELYSFDNYGDYPELADITINDFKVIKGINYVLTMDGLYKLDWSMGIIAHHQFKAKNLQDIYLDPTGTFWIATHGRGLIEWLADGTQRYYTTEDGLSHNIIYAVYPDKNGHLWLPSNKGLMRFDKKSKEIKIYLEEDGLPHDEFNQFAHCQLPDGRLLLGGLNGLVYFDPEKIEASDLEESNIPLVVTSCQFLNDDTGEIIDYTAQLLNQGSLKLSPHTKSISLRFSLLEFSENQSQEYRYKIEGVDRQWNKTDANLRIYQVPYGEHTLRIEAISQGRKFRKQLAIPIISKPPFIHTRLFYFLCALGFVVLGLSFARYRIYQLDRKNKRLDREVKRRTRKIESDKALISQQYEEVEQLNRTKDRLIAIIGHDLKDHISTFQGIEKKINFLIQSDQIERIPLLAGFIENSAHDLSLLLDNLLNWALKQRNELHLHPDEIQILPIVADAVALLKKFSHQKEINIVIDIDEGFYAYVDNLILHTVLRNLLHNAIKFSHRGGTIQLTATKEGKHLKLMVSDHGIGISEAMMDNIFLPGAKEASLPGTENEKGTGLGLALCQELLVAQNGRLTVSSQLGKGSVFSVFLPLKARG